MIYHVVPHNDLSEHKSDGASCPCYPEFEAQDNGDIIIIHFAYDGRDIIEEIENESQG